MLSIEHWRVAHGRAAPDHCVDRVMVMTRQSLNSFNFEALYSNVLETHKLRQSQCHFPSPHKS